VKGFYHVVVIPDTQFPFIHAPSYNAVCSYIKDARPDGVVALGDWVDFTSISKFRNRIPLRSQLTLEEEEELLADTLSDVKNLCSRKTWFQFIPGNHEDRYSRYLLDNAKQCAHLNPLESIVLMTGWKYMGDYSDGAGTWIGKKGGLWATHGEIVRKHSAYSAKAHYEKYGHSVIVGHTHRLGAYYHTDRVGTYAAFEAGTLCDPAKTPRASATVDWQHGFAVAWVSRTSRRFHVELVSINKGSFVRDGRRYGG